MAKKNKSKGKHVPLSVLTRRYNRNEKRNALLGKIVNYRKLHPSDPNDKK